VDTRGRAGSDGAAAGAVATRWAPTTVPPVDALALAALDATAALVLICDDRGRVLLANPALQRFTGRPAGDLLGRCFWDVVTIPEEVELAQEALAQAMAGRERLPREVDWLATSGRRRRVELQSSVLADRAGRPYATAFVGIDVTDQREREARIHRQATTDALTGVANRGVAVETLGRHLDGARGGGCGLLFLDLDDFKGVNDRLGHVVGDRVLVEAAARLQELAGPDDVVARFGGDEFVLLRPGADRAELLGLAERLEARMRAPFAVVPERLRVGVSIGTATGCPGEDTDEVLGRADREMYGVKTRRHGRGRIPAAVGDRVGA
jgi:diguanylate cyclase (GGDEF)-like protein/PAS domain S-box-containing protein